ncbi:MAG: hypothetical protein SFU21_07170 [Flavihumibacter sp.]|nr:hypothetical protein [Flavihumibacter sp.]
MEKYIQNEKENFKNIFSGSFLNFKVTATLNMHEVKNEKEVKKNEHLVEILTPEAFGEGKGGDAEFGGLKVFLNSDYINEDGSVTSKATLSHELGHTGGLVHPFEDINKEGQFKNGNAFSYPISSQIKGIDKLNNFMSYPQRYLNINTNEGMKKLYSIYENPGKATASQLLTIMKNYLRNNLNYGNK